MSRKRRVMAAMREWFERAEAERKKQPKTINLHIGMTVDSGERKIMSGLVQWADERKVWWSERD
jgi:hypothetical protein